jgi:hypothetical protein
MTILFHLMAFHDGLATFPLGVRDLVWILRDQLESELLLTKRRGTLVIDDLVRYFDL